MRPRRTKYESIAKTANTICISDAIKSLLISNQISKLIINKDEVNSKSVLIVEKHGIPLVNYSLQYGIYSSIFFIDSYSPFVQHHGAKVVTLQFGYNKLMELKKLNCNFFFQ